MDTPTLLIPHASTITAELVSGDVASSRHTDNVADGHASPEQNTYRIKRISPSPDMIGDGDLLDSEDHITNG